MDNIQLELLKWKNREKMQEETHQIQNQLRETFGYNPMVNLKAVNYKAQNNSINILNKDIEDHIIKEDSQFQPLQKLIQEERQRIMVEQQGIDLKETIRFFIEKINQYNSIYEVNKRRNNDQNYTQRPYGQKFQDINNPSKTTKESLQKSLNDLKKQIVDINNSNNKLKNMDILHENDMKRYTGDDGRITNFHFVLNCHNLVPVFKELQNYTPQGKTLRSKTSSIYSKQKTQYANKIFSNQEQKHHLVQKFEEKLDEKQKEIDLFYPIQKTQRQLESEKDDSTQKQNGLNNDQKSIDKFQKTLIFSDQIKKKSSIKVNQMKIEQKMPQINSSKSSNASPTAVKKMIKETDSLLKKTGVKTLRNRNKSVNNSPQRRLDLSKTIQIKEENKQVRKNKRLSFEMSDQNRTQKIVADMISTNFDKDNLISTILEKDLSYRNNQKNQDMKNVSFGFTRRFDDKIKQNEIQTAQNENGGTNQSKEILNLLNEFSTNEQNFKKIELPILFKDQFEINEEKLDNFKASETDTRQKVQNISLLKNQEQKDKLLKETLKRRKQVIQAFIQRKQPKYFHPGGKRLTLPFEQESIIIKSQRDYSLVENIQNDKKMKLRAQEDMMSDLNVLGGPPKKLGFQTTDIRHDFVDLKVTKMVKQTTQEIL